MDTELTCVLKATHDSEGLLKDPKIMCSLSSSPRPHSPLHVAPGTEFSFCSVLRAFSCCMNLGILFTGAVGLDVTQSFPANPGDKLE